MDRVQFAAEASIEGNTLSGLAHVFGTRALINGKFYETFAAGSFDEALKDSDVRAFLEHDRGKLIGRQKSGTLRLSATDLALAYEIDLPNTTYANDYRELVLRGDQSEMSFGIVPGEVEWTRAPDGLPERLHHMVRKLVDVSPVTLPAFDSTSVLLHSDGFAEESQASQLVRIRARVRGVHP